MDLRSVWKHMPLDTHIANSTDIARIASCPWKFRLPRIFGATPSFGQYGSTLPGKIAHEVLASAVIGPIREVWDTNPQDPSLTHDLLWKELESIKEETFRKQKEMYEAYGTEVSNECLERASDRIFGLTEAFVYQFMIKEPPPERIRTELTITNVKMGHEGRLDALIEHKDNYTVLDWKTYSDSAPQSHGYDHYQIVANGLLANYRHKKAEQDFTMCRLAIVYYSGVYIPRCPSELLIERVRQARKYVLDCFCGRSAPRMQQPPWPVCKECEYYEACRFYKGELWAAREGLLNPGHDRIRRTLWWRRYVTIDKRAVSHKIKYLVQIAFSAFGESKGIEELRKIGVIDEGYVFAGYDKDEHEITLRKKDKVIGFGQRTVVRIIGLERDVPLLACLSVKGSVHTLESDLMTLKVFGTDVERAARQLVNMPILLMKDEVDLTARELEPIDFVHRRLGA